MNSITHFSHEHPLYLNQKPAKPREFYCVACLGELSEEKHSDVYGCQLCEFFLHKSCAELPMEIVHINHLKQPRHPPHSYGVYRGYADIRPRFFYYCYLCDFSLDINSAFRKKDIVVSCNKDLTLHHQSHKHHPLMVHPRPATFLCDACGVKNEDLFYHCSPCHYLIHKRCAMLPSTTLSDIHEHPLTLSFSLPSQYYSFCYNCDVCGKILSHESEDWLYYCELCRYFVHIRCMATKKPQIEVDLMGLRTDDMPYLPTSDIYVELIRRFLLTNDSLANIEQEVSVFSHKHPLVYSNHQFFEDENEDGEEKMCDACIEPILNSPCYHCAECRYFLHFNCARLRDELQHPSHPHQLILACHTRFDETFNCNFCLRDCNGFRFCCTTQGCQFNLDLKCAALPNVIKHEYHNHPLFQFSLDDYEYCRGCGYTIWKGHVFGCKSCKFYMHPRCIHLPKTLKHRFDSKHPLTLRYPPHAYHPKPFDCYQCEKEINPNYWLYHCEECDLSLHVECANIAGENNNIKFGHKVQIGSHPHALKYVYKASVRSSLCAQCNGSDAYFTLECETCNFRKCKACVKKIEILS